MWRDSLVLTKRATEVALVGKAQLLSKLRQGKFGLGAQAMAGFKNSELAHKLSRRGVVVLAEGAN